MSETSQTQHFPAEKNSISALEAELAFILAREALLQNQPDTIYKAAQIKAYSSIRENLESQLEEMRLQLDLLMAKKST